MLKCLHIENYVLIETLDMELDPGLNIITGETGAGKSILLGALGLLMGNRADTSALSNQKGNCIIEGTFSVGRYGIESFFAENDLEYDDPLIIRRVINPSGKSRAYINDLPVQLGQLKELSARLIDIHSQHQTLYLADENFRTSILDSVAGNGELIDTYRRLYDRLSEEKRELARLKEAASADARELEWLRHQWTELDKASLKQGEQEELEARLSELSHFEEIKLTLASADELLNREETGILPALKNITTALSRVSGKYPSGNELGSRLISVAVELRDISDCIISETERIESDPQALERTQDRLDKIYSLQSKHKVSTLEELIELEKEYAERLQGIESSEGEILAREKQIKELTDSVSRIADDLTISRKRAAKELSVQVASLLDKLGMPRSRFIIDISPAGRLRPDGADTIGFLFSANDGIEPAPVEKCASGGELSRVMLALKSVAATGGRLPSIIFDEIDTGVSGKIADAMGGIMERMASTMQVVNITHLPQVASKGDTHFRVYKANRPEGKITTGIEKLSPQDRKAEIAMMLSGTTVTDAALSQAELLLSGK